MTNISCCEYSVKTPDGGQQICPKYGEFFTKIKCILLAFIRRIYHDARTSECQTHLLLSVKAVCTDGNQALCV